MCDPYLGRIAVRMLTCGVGLLASTTGYRSQQNFSLPCTSRPSGFRYDGLFSYSSATYPTDSRRAHKRQSKNGNRAANDKIRSIKVSIHFAPRRADGSVCI